MKIAAILASLALPLLLTSCVLVELPFKIIRSITGAIVENEHSENQEAIYIAIEHSGEAASASASEHDAAPPLK